MNERIRELAIEARLITVDGITRYALDNEFEQRFTELIVQECILTIQMGITRDGYDTEKYQRSMKHIKQIKEHFDVAESSSQAEQEAAAFIAAEDKKVASRYGYVPKLHPSEWKD